MITTRLPDADIPPLQDDDLPFESPEFGTAGFLPQLADEAIADSSPEGDAS